jgi:hypothetical protein
MGHAGLKQKPTNFYNYPYWKQYPHLKKLDNGNSKYCLNGRLTSDIYFDQINQFVGAMNLDENKDKPFFFVNLFAIMTHDQFEIAREFDIRFKQQLEEFSNKGYLSETLLIVMSDHGGRQYAYGEKIMKEFGQEEYPNPFLSIKLPNSMANSLYYDNFMKNSAKLVTAFDIHKTLKHFYFLSKNGLEKSSKSCHDLMSTSEPQIRSLRGISLFENVPSNRECSEALIPLAFCSILNKTEIDPHEFRAETEKTVELMAKFLHAKTVQVTQNLRSKCKEYEFDKILLAKNFLFANQKYYEVKISLKPGPSHFSAIMKFVKKEFKLVGNINRDNLYGTQPKCLFNTSKEYKYKSYCYCY